MVFDGVAFGWVARFLDCRGRHDKLAVGDWAEKLLAVVVVLLLDIRWLTAGGQLRRVVVSLMVAHFLFWLRMSLG